MPLPRCADTATEPGSARSSAATSSGSAWSTLFHTSSSGRSCDVDRTQHLAHRVDALLGTRRAGVDDVHEQIDGGGLVERGAEGLDELVRKALDEPNRVGQQHGLTPGSASRRVVGSSVVNSWSATRASGGAVSPFVRAPARSLATNRFNSVDLPALV